MTPKHLIEVLRVSYDFSYAREISLKMVKAAFPLAQDHERPQLQNMAMKGFLLGERPLGLCDWHMEDVREFLALYEQYFSEGGRSIAGYDVVKKLLSDIVKRAKELSEPVPEDLPLWFRMMCRA